MTVPDSWGLVYSTAQIASRLPSTSFPMVVALGGSWSSASWRLAGIEMAVGPLAKEAAPTPESQIYTKMLLTMAFSLPNRMRSVGRDLNYTMV